MRCYKGWGRNKPPIFAERGELSRRFRGFYEDVTFDFALLGPPFFFKSFPVANFWSGPELTIVSFNVFTRFTIEGVQKWAS